MITRMLALGMLFVLCSPLMADESTRIVVSGLPMTFTSPTAADFQAGSVTTTTTGSNVASYTVSITDGHRSRSIVTRIQCGSPCPTIGSSTGIALQWRIAGAGGQWQTLTSTASNIEMFSLVDGGPARNNSIEFRMLTAWNAAPGQRSFNVSIHMVVSA